MLSFTKNTLLLSASLAVSLTATAQDGAPSDEATRELETVVVRGEFIPEPQRETSQVASFLSAEDLSRQGDSNAALALTRLSGLSVVGGKFAYVRGLGDRYSYALLNGSLIPSPEPLRRTVPLDLFPSSVLKGAAVQKTYSANYGADFGGGVIDLTTLSTPAEPFFNVKGSIGGNTVTTGEDRLLVEGGDYDWTGFDDGTREYPDIFRNLVDTQLEVTDLSPADREALGEALATPDLNEIKSDTAKPDYSISVDGGTMYSDGKYDLGLVFAGGFSRGVTNREAQRGRAEQGAGGAVIIREAADVDESSVDATLNGLASVSLGWDTNEVRATGLYIHSTTDQAQIAIGVRPNISDNLFRTDSTSWIERELTFGQLEGEHELYGFDLTWRASGSRSTRYAPFEQTIVREIFDGVPTFDPNTSSYNMRFGNLEDEIVGFGGEIARDFDLGGREVRLTVGGDYSETDRLSLDNAFNFTVAGIDPGVARARPVTLFGPDQIGPDGFTVNEIVSTQDGYLGYLEIAAGFAQADIDFTDFIQGTFGVRVEDGEQLVQTFSRRLGQPGSAGGLGSQTLLENGAPFTEEEDPYILPAATLTWNFADDLQLRLGYSETIARPQFRELSESTFTDPDTDRTFRGNSNLIDTELTNYDARVEYYMGRNAFITGAAFYKELENPIEEFLFSPSEGVFESSFINSPKAILSGFELEYRNKFDMPFGNDWVKDRTWLFSTNYTFTESEIEVGDGDTVLVVGSNTPQAATNFGFDGEPLQGTPENILNLQFGWESANDQATLLVGWVDERILQRGDATEGVLDVVEDPGVQVDLVYNRDFVAGGRDFTLGFEVRNLLDEDKQEFQEASDTRVEFNTYERGISFSASLKASF